ncbi:hypothetical protein [Falsirhodobacter halotolerans]|uniref:hypothetical protein n=1 Tax=Falsirhodobacter halotolerans TaxID=1146892 RepID=UPI001FD19F09|nr:hypothetical protein [Falsirhodobacter halotolerans]MCJ8139376.1 hypothetical protein [Falsirhodobacter halotolerans]
MQPERITPTHLTRSQFQAFLHIRWKNSDEADTVFISDPQSKDDAVKTAQKATVDLADHVNMLGLTGWIAFSGFVIAMDHVALIGADVQEVAPNVRVQ